MRGTTRLAGKSDVVRLWVCTCGCLSSKSLSNSPSQGQHHVLDETYIPLLTSKKKQIMAARRRTPSILGWDVPFSMVRFTTVLGACIYGEVFGGSLDDEAVVIKTFKPHFGATARAGFDREIDILP